MEKEAERASGPEMKMTSAAPIGERTGMDFDLAAFEKRQKEKAAWLREQIAFAIFNSSNPAHIRDEITLQNIGGNPEIKTALGDGWTATSNLGLDWSFNRDSFLKLADVAIAAFEKADEDGSAYL